MEIQIPVLNDIMVIFALSIGVIFICHRLKIPVIIGFIIAGVIAGPHGLRLVAGVHDVELMAEIGVVLLLFTIGLEFSFNSLLRIKKSVLLGGGLQVLLTVTFCAGPLLILGKSPSQALFVGFLISLSSTAVVLKLLQERAIVETPAGNNSLAILIFQDISVVPMMLVTPLLSGQDSHASPSPLPLIGMGIGIVVMVVIGAKWLIPFLLFQVAKTRNREVFLLTIAMICLGTALATSQAGLSLALGAFLAGLIISESEYSHQALGAIMPFRDIFTSLFFVSIGMLLNLSHVVENFTTILAAGVLVLVVKSIITTVSCLILGLSLRIAVIVGLTLAQVGEFSFVLSRVGLSQQVISPNFSQIFLSFSVLTLIATPFLIQIAPRVAQLVSQIPQLRRISNGRMKTKEPNHQQLHEHLIIIGYDLIGRTVARAARATQIPYIVIEMNPETVKTEKEHEVPIFYGDASQEVVLKHARLETARVVVVAINDPTVTQRITQFIKQLAPNVYLIVRTRFLLEMNNLYKLGANEVIPEEFETSIEIFSRVLVHYLVPRDDIHRFITEVRADGYEMFRQPFFGPDHDETVHLEVPHFEIAALRLDHASPIIGRTIGDMNLKASYQVYAVALQRQTEVISNPSTTTVLRERDLVYVLGTPDRISALSRRFFCSQDSQECRVRSLESPATT